jgi:hypothetical protein
MKHRDYYEEEADAQAHNTAAAFPLQPEGDSWVGALCGRHAHEAKGRFGAEVHAVLCENAACPAQCSVCNLEFQPREQVA